eukprot:gene2355-4570_t
MSAKVDLIIAGAGVIGLSAARAIAMTRKIDILVIESRNNIGQGISSRNSEVIHAGLYYTPASRKANFCVHGRKMLYEYLESRQVPYSKCGKLVVATTSEESKLLSHIHDCSLKNGVENTEILSKEDVSHLEPNVNCLQALYSSQTGIFDTHTYMMNLQGDAEEHGVNIVFNCEVNGGKIESDGIKLSTNQGDIYCDSFINAAGLSSQQLISTIHGFPKNKIPFMFYSKGCYFKLKGPSPFSRLVYPVPSQGGLGVHATIDLSGSAKFGPDVTWMRPVATAATATASLSTPMTTGHYTSMTDNDIDENMRNDPNFSFVHTTPPSDDELTVDPKRADMFYDAIRRYWPDIPPDSLEADYAGIRPKLLGPYPLPDSFYHRPLDGLSATDFFIQGPKEHGVRGIYNLFGIESPGLTSSLAIGEYLCKIIVR